MLDTPLPKKQPRLPDCETYHLRSRHIGFVVGHVRPTTRGANDIDLFPCRISMFILDHLTSLDKDHHKARARADPNSQTASVLEGRAKHRAAGLPRGNEGRTSRLQVSSLELSRVSDDRVVVARK